MFDNLDFSKLKLPIEPQNLIYIYLAYKIINNLDKLDISRLSGNIRAPPCGPFGSLGSMTSLPRQSQNFMFFVLLIIGAAFLILNNILNRISFSSISVENLSAQNPMHRLKQAAKACPLRKCPLFSDVDISQCLKQCPMKMKKCPIKMKQFPMRTNSENDDGMEEACVKNETSAVPETDSVVNSVTDSVAEKK